MVKVITILLFPLILHASSHDRAQKFFVDHYEAAEQLYFCEGIPIQLSLGVWALESGYGTSTAAQRNNLAGIASYKGGKHWKRFKTKADFYRSFAAIFQQPCYSNDLRPKTVGEYLRAMEWGCCSYHRSREYTHKIKWIIKRYKLEIMTKHEIKSKIKVIEAEILIKQSQKTELEKQHFFIDKKVMAWSDLEKYLKDNPQEERYKNPVVFSLKSWNFAGGKASCIKDKELQVGNYYNETHFPRNENVLVFKDMKSYNKHYF